MESEYIITQATRILEQIKSNTELQFYGNHAEALDFIRTLVGDESHFYISMKNVHPLTWPTRRSFATQVMESFIRYINEGLLDQKSIVRQAQIDAVSDFLLQAQALLTDSSVHPAAPMMLIGAALEQFLRDWIDEENISIGSNKPGLNTYASTLRTAKMITKQDKKDIDSWAGLRNHAAHGEWEEVSDRRRISNALEGVNLFMRKYGMD